MRKYLPTFAELIDRLSILQLKKMHLSEHREKYTKEIEDILHDIDLIIKEQDLNASVLRAIVVLSQMNVHIWNTEEARGDGDTIRNLNGIRNEAKNKISNERIEHKTEYNDISDEFRF